MALIQRANVILEVADDFLDKYLAQGYNQIDKKGKIVKKGLPTTLNDYKLAYNQLQKEVKALQATVKALDTENKELNDTITKLKAVKSNKSKVNEE